MSLLAAVGNVTEDDVSAFYDVAHIELPQSTKPGDIVSFPSPETMVAIPACQIRLFQPDYNLFGEGDVVILNVLGEHLSPLLGIISRVTDTVLGLQVPYVVDLYIEMFDKQRLREARMGEIVRLSLSDPQLLEISRSILAERDVAQLEAQDDENARRELVAEECADIIVRLLNTGTPVCQLKEVIYAPGLDYVVRGRFNHLCYATTTDRDPRLLPQSVTDRSLLTRFKLWLNLIERRVTQQTA